jgi:putative peptide maturation system protein
MTTTTSLHQTLNDTLDFLAALARDGTRPREAQAHLGPLRERSAGTCIRLVWEEESYDSFVHYDALLHVAGEGTVSLSFCPERAVPWPLRGVHRWRERELLRVNEQVLEIDQAIGCLDFIWDDARIIERLVNVCLIQEALAEEPFNLTDEELQEAMDAFRRACRLYSAEETLRWMARRGMSHVQLENYVRDEAIVARLRERVTAARVEPYFAEHAAEFDAARIARITYADEDAARHALAQIWRGEHTFYEAAERRFCDKESRADEASVRFAVVRRGDAPEGWAAVFDGTPGVVVVPLAEGGEFALIRILERVPASLDAATRRTIAKLLFEEWLEERRQAAHIEWNWGSAHRITQVES